MIIVPEIQTVVLLVPRTGSGSLRRAVLGKYPQAYQLYRHMEADGVPVGYDRWRRVGVVRHPIDRLFSMYKFCRDGMGGGYPEYAARMRRSTEGGFEHWLLHNETVFGGMFDSEDGQRSRAQFAIRHALPENRKSQWHYLRPDLGTVCYPFHWMWLLYADLGLGAPHLRENATEREPWPELSGAGLDHIRRHHGWDLEHWDAMPVTRTLVGSAA